MKTMLSSMTIREFNEWVLYAQVEPFEEQRADWRAAHIVSTLMNIFRKKGTPVIKISDMLLKFVSSWLPEAEKKPQTWQEQKAIGYQWYLMSLSPKERRKKEQEKALKQAA